MPAKAGYQLFEDDGSARAALVPMGTRVTRIMEPKLQAAATFANADEFVSLPNGCRAFRVVALAVPAGEAVIVVWSATAADGTALETLADSVTTTTTGEWDTPDGVALTNLMALPAAAPVSPWVVAPDSAKIKSIGLQQTGGTLTPAILETIE